MKDSFVLFRSVYDALMAFPAEHTKEALRIIGAYAMDGVLPDNQEGIAYGMFLSVKPLIDKTVAKSNARAASGKAGGEANGSKHEANESKREANGSKPEANTKQTEAYKGEMRKEKGESNNRTDTNVSVRSTEAVQRIVSAWNELESAGIKPIRDCKSGTKRCASLVARLKEYSEEDVLTAIRNCRDSRFLRGYNAKGWVITFDWLIKPNNFPKVLEGNYADTKPQSGDHVRGQYDYYENDWTDLLRDDV